jgi:ubiquinone/menaquinone biosynthesis C-methylase UbiE
MSEHGGGHEEGKHHVCPWWMGFLLISPLRRLLESPRRILGPHVRRGMTVLEPGCGMGYFTLPLARMVGPEGKVVCLDLQERMIRSLERRIRRAGLEDRVEAAVCRAGDLGADRWKGRVDLVAAIHVIHEVPSPPAFLAQVYDLLKPGGRLLVLEPAGHVDEEEFRTEMEAAREAGFVELDAPDVRKNRSALLERL